MSKTVLRALCILLATSAALWAKKAGPLQFNSGQSWKWSKSEQVRIMDKNAGMSSTQASASVSRYKVEKVYDDGAALVLATLVSGDADKDAGQSRKLLMTTDGLIYEIGPEELGSIKRLRFARDYTNLGEQTRAPVEWHKMPLDSMEVGAKTYRQSGSERWVIFRLKDENIQGVMCEVYRARQARSDRTTAVETLWLNMVDGVLLKKESLRIENGEARRIVSARI